MTTKRKSVGDAAASHAPQPCPAVAGPHSSAAGVVALHRNRMFDWKPSAVVAIAACPGAPLFAVGYENGSLELWDMHQLVCTQTVVGPALELTSVEWARDTVDNSWRTFAAYLDGTVAEVLWRQAAVAHAVDSCGGVVWALAAQPRGDVKPGFAHQLAAACDDGSVRLFGCEGSEPGLVLERVLTRLDGKLLCCAWHNGSRALAVGGTTGNIHLLDATTGREQLRITVGTSATAPPTVWNVLSLPDGTLVSGDSDGATQMWDARFGTLLQRFVQHRADVLALAAAEGGNCVFAAGVDSQVALFQRVTSAHPHKPDSWAYTHYKRPHTHDVRALATVTLGADKGSVLLSGGVDAQLLAYPARAFLQEHPMRLCKCPQRPICQATVARQASDQPTQRPLLLMAQHGTLDVWQTAEASALSRQQLTGSHAQGEGHLLDIAAGPRHLLRMQLKDARISSAALSLQGDYVACTTSAGTRAYQITSSSAGTSAATRLPLQPLFAEPAVAVALSRDVMVVALRDGSLASCTLPSCSQVAHVPPRMPSGMTLWTSDTQAWRNHCAAASRLTVSSDGSMLAAMGSHGISLHRLPKLEAHGRLLKTDHAMTAMAFSDDGSLLAATTSACQLLVWDISADCKQLPWCLSNAEAITSCIERLPGSPTGISFSPCTSSSAGGTFAGPRLVVYGPGGLVHFDLSRPVDRMYLEAVSAKRQRTRIRPDQQPQVEDRPESRGSNGRVVRSVQPCLWLGHVTACDILLLEKPWEEALAMLPAPLLRHRYGS